MKYLVLLVAFFCLAAKADVEVHESFTYYTVTPLSKALLLETVNKSSPIIQNKKVFHGHTAYQIKWQFEWKKHTNGCKLSDIKVDVNLVYTMPKLESSAKDIQEVWSNWYPNLERHEKEHGQLAIDMAKKIDNALKSLGSFANCSELEKAANAIGNKQMFELKAANEDYDTRTNYGESQKAWLYQHL